MVSTGQAGIIPRALVQFFQQVSQEELKCTTYCSFLQIYNEKMFDLLQDMKAKNPLTVREDKHHGIFVEGLSEYVITNAHEAFALLRRGERNRIKRSTHMNMNSSRSHSIFQLLLETDQVDKNGMLRKAKLSFIDLAGSEKINKEEEMGVKHMQELRNINLSLTTLGKVIQILGKPSSLANSHSQHLVIPHVPFRDSKLTRILQDSLGGNTQTYLICNIAPIESSIEESISTLKFADRAKEVMQMVKKNEYSAKDDVAVQKLQKEVLHLKEVLNLKRKNNSKDLTHQLYTLKEENYRLREYALSFNEVEKMRQENKEMRLELQKMKNTMETRTMEGSPISSPTYIPISYSGSQMCEEESAPFGRSHKPNMKAQIRYMDGSVETEDDKNI